MGLPDPGYTALYEAAALLEPERSLFRVSGARAARMLDGLLTADVAPLDGRRAVYGFVLTPKGRIVAELRAFLRDGEIVLDSPAGCAEPLLAHLRKYVPPIFAEVEPIAEETVLSLVGPLAAEAVRLALSDDAEGRAPGELEPLEVVGVDGVTLISREPIEGPGFDIYAHSGSAVDIRTRLLGAVRTVGGDAVEPEVYDVWRVERGIPECGRDFGADTLPQETGQTERAVSFEKGCYTGQEVVARIHYRGHVNRRMCGLRLSARGGLPAPEPAAPLFDGDRERGHLTSVVDSPRLGLIGLGYLRREIEPGTRVRVGAEDGPEAGVVDLPFTLT